MPRKKTAMARTAKGRFKKKTRKRPRSPAKKKTRKRRPASRALARTGPRATPARKKTTRGRGRPKHNPTAAQAKWGQWVSARDFLFAFLAVAIVGFLKGKKIDIPHFANTRFGKMFGASGLYGIPMMLAGWSARKWLKWDLAGSIVGGLGMGLSAVYFYQLAKALGSDPGGWWKGTVALEGPSSASLEM
jgi:hypothetical protein